MYTYNLMQRILKPTILSTGYNSLNQLQAAAIAHMVTIISPKCISISQIMCFSLMEMSSFSLLLFDLWRNQTGLFSENMMLLNCHFALKSFKDL